MQLHLRSFGSGEPLIILHGMLGMLDNWQTFGKEMSKDHLVYLIDLRNHGKSGDSAEMNYPAMAEDLKETMEAQWLYEGAIVMGHSMGGKVAMQLALDYPDLVKALVVIDIAPITYPGGHELILGALQQVDLTRIKSRQEVSDQLMESLKNPTIVNFLMKNLSRSKDGGYQWKMNLDVIKENYQHLLAAPTFHGDLYDGPSLFVAGKQSDYITPENQEEIFRWFPEARLEIIEDSGHWVHADQPKILLKILQDFLAKSV
ncbi:MAG: alpha/beta fold hydrolase [Saprospiraceae bacterium]|nr:alpha/beta fold hydrolase [Saprospiraceae bacterium]